MAIGRPPSEYLCKLQKRFDILLKSLTGDDAILNDEDKWYLNIKIGKLQRYPTKIYQGLKKA